ncbi:hypothetical protein L1987_84443 [Smallanthus sonchifolius]|uniref:Uncharacterized protein n=1 Tax=Smallanthus sonchifolius TaxID=185202 RepID=A0ACB8YFC6_9ASTR|nr:hypothetical protein L1987_84443 [Smallanthus sonchifolius]
MKENWRQDEGLLRYYRYGAKSKLCDTEDVVKLCCIGLLLRCYRYRVKSKLCDTEDVVKLCCIYLLCL